MTQTGKEAYLNGVGKAKVALLAYSNDILQGCTISSLACESGVPAIQASSEQPTSNLMVFFFRYPNTLLLKPR
jgi:hypothetical protein